ncbi:Small subunit (SSU) processome component [Rhizophlyctis rosea]|nr:Small subunit (SSU) processome component [Rhizophlyctis rosea]
MPPTVGTSEPAAGKKKARGKGRPLLTALGKPTAGEQGRSEADNSPVPTPPPTKQSDKNKTATPIETGPKKKPAPDPHNQNMKKYTRQQGGSIAIKNIQDKKLKGTLRKTEKKFQDAAYKAAQAELLLPTEAGYLEAEEGTLEKTWKFTQAAIKDNVDMNTSNKMFDLKLPDLGPYTTSYTPNGRHLLIGGRKGHIATFDWRTAKLGCELQLRETVRDVTWLHNHTMFAVAQKKYTYIYDNSGMELHCMRDHVDVTQMEFLPWHFLLATVVCVVGCVGGGYCGCGYGVRIGRIARRRAVVGG